MEMQESKRYTFFFCQNFLVFSTEQIKQTFDSRFCHKKQQMHGLIALDTWVHAYKIRCNELLGVVSKHEELRKLLFTIHQLFTIQVHMAPVIYTLYQEIAYLKDWNCGVPIWPPYHIIYNFAANYGRTSHGIPEMCMSSISEVKKVIRKHTSITCPCF